MVEQLRKEIIRLYRECLRSAAKCPKAEHRHMMNSYVRLKFRSNPTVQDHATIVQMLRDAREELERMEYYHSLYQVKLETERQEQQENCSPEEPSAALAKQCPNCDEPFQPDAKYCIYCGVKRPAIL